MMTGCGGGEETPAASTPATTPSDGSQSASELAGYFQKCFIFSGSGTALNGKAYVLNYSVTSGGAYSYNLFFSDSTSCATAMNSGGNNIATYTNEGTFSVKGTNTLPATSATKVEFTQTVSQLVVRPTYAEGATLRDFLNTCTGLSSTFTGGATASTRSMSGVTCPWDATFNLVNPPTLNVVKYQTWYNDGTSLNAGARTDLWGPAAGSYATSYSETFTKY